jgi:hypothetical protein
VNVYVYIVCVCMHCCFLVYTLSYLHTHTHTYTHTDSHGPKDNIYTANKINFAQYKAMFEKYPEFSSVWQSTFKF